MIASELKWIISTWMNSIFLGDVFLFLFCIWIISIILIEKSLVIICLWEGRVNSFDSNKNRVYNILFVSFVLMYLWNASLKCALCTRFICMLSWFILMCFKFTLVELLLLHNHLQNYANVFIIISRRLHSIG